MNRMNIIVSTIAVGLLAGCCGYCCKCRPPRHVDQEGFVWGDGSVVEKEAPSEYYIIRYDYLTPTNLPNYRRMLQKRNFVELRQLKDSVVEVVDGERREIKGKRLPGRNWRQWINECADNVRVKFVDEDYDLAAEGRKECPEGYAPLFNGKDFSGWKGLVQNKAGFNMPHCRRAMIPEVRWGYEAEGMKAMKEHWSVRDGVMFFDGKKGGYNITPEKQYGNFEVLVDWRLLRVYGDSGFYLRGLPQIQIWDPTMWNGLGSGGIWNNTTALFNATTREDRPIGDWNTFRIRIVGNRTWVWFNGVLVTDGVEYQNRYHPDKPIPLIDNFELQCHGDPVEFRNLFIKELPEAPEDIPDPEKAVRGEQIDLLKDGLAGWEATDPKAKMGWSVKGGELVNYVTDDPSKNLRGGSGGTHLKTKREDFYDFDLSYDAYVGKKCNSGVYLRGRYEIQVNDSYGRKPDTHNMGCLYDLIAPSVSAEKPAGEWQHVDLTIYKRHLTVALNGVKIIDNRPIAGVTPGAIDGDEFVPGPILLQGDHSNVTFRNMVLTPILK